MENNLLSFSKLIQFLVWAEENKVDAILVVIMYHNVKKIDGKQCSRLISILFDQVSFICIFARWMVILQDSCKTKGYLARSCKITLCLARILQDNHSSCKYANKWNLIEQDRNETRTLLPINFDVSSCKILPESCKILQDNHSLLTGELSNPALFMYVGTLSCRLNHFCYYLLFNDLFLTFLF